MATAAEPVRTPGPAAHRPRVRGRRLRRRLARISRLLAWLLSAWVGGSGLAWAQVAPGALPAGGQVVTGSGQLVYGSNLLVVNQGSRQLGLDWQSFNIGSGAMVQFRQPGPDAVALNRVLGNSGSEIYGRLQANGQVFLTNPNGILFAPGAKVDVGGLVASTLDLSQQDFAAGLYRFDGSSGASVVNQGSLRASAGGYLALFGKDVSNQGAMTVDAGSVVLASGRAATVSISGSGLISAVVDPGLVPGSVRNAGSIAADGGVVTLSAHSARDIAASLVNNTGIVRANALVERGGEIWITGDSVATSGALSATAPDGGQGGRIMVLADLKTGAATVAGTLDASAGSGGQGGFIETSGARVKIAEGTRVDAASRGGQAGTWLIDPTDFTIAASGGDISGATLSGSLNNSTTVTIQSTQGASGTAGDVNVNDAVTWSSAATLTLNAQNNVNVNAPITSSGAGVLSLEVGQASVATGNTGTWNIAAPVNLAAGTNRLRTKIGTNGSVVQYESVTTLARLQELDGNATVLAGNYVLGADIDATSTATGLGFNPIGNETTFSTSQSFSGRFDGLGHTITALSVNRPSSNFTGLFAATAGATISNLTLAGGSFAGSQYVGSVAGRADNSTNLTNLRSSANVSVVDDGNTGVAAGGLVGYLAGGMTRSSASGTVTADTNISNAYAGGAVGWQATGFLTDVSATGNVTATQRVANNSAGGFYTGGLVGYFTGTSITRGTATGDVTGRAFTGGLAGYANASGSITGSRAEGTVTASGTGNNVGGLIGQALGTGSLSDSIALGDVTGGGTTGNVGGLVGLYQMSGALTRGEANGSVSGGNVTGGLVGYFNTTATLVTGTSRGATVTGTTWAGGLVGYSEAASITDASARANVTGTINGGSGGLAGRTGGSVLRSSATGNVTAGSGSVLGGLVGIATGSGTMSMSSVSATGNVTSTASNDYVGGLVGEFQLPGGLATAEASGTVTGGRFTGGLVGYYNANSTLSAGTARNTVVSGGEYAGGLVGYMQGGTITGSTAVANVTGVGNAGGLVGRTAGSVASSSATGSVTATTNAGGLVAIAEGGGAYSDVSAAGAVTATTANGYVGGLLAYVTATGGVQRGTATGNVSGGRTTGGAIGYYSANGTLANLRAEGSASGSFDVGGLIGYATGSGSLTDAVALGNVTITGTGGSGGGLVGYFGMNGGLLRGDAAGNVAGSSNAGGMFGYYASSAAIGATAGTARASSVSGSGWVGGYLGYMSSAATITGITSAANVTATGNGNAGGLAGRTGGAISSSSASGTVVSGVSSYAGGLVALAQGTGAMTDVSATGSVSASGNSYTGGLAGEVNLTGGILRATAGGNVTGGTRVGGLVGNYSSNGDVRNARATGTVSGETNIGGLIAVAASSGGLYDSSATGSVTASDGNGSVGGLVGSMSFTAGAARLQADGNVSGGYYTGGLIGYSNSGALVDTLSRATTVSGGRNYAGGLVGYNETGALTNATASANVTGTNVVGGLVGRTAGAITNGRATGNVVGASNAGGLAGEVYGTLTDTSATGNVTGGSGTSVGGLVGYQGNGSILRGTATGNASGGANVGGLVGYFTPGQSNGIQDSGATGSATGTSWVGGLVGQFYFAGSVSNSTAAGAVNGNNGSGAGGLIGYFGSSGTVTDSRATGNVTGASYVGGLVGYGDSNGGIANSTATGSVFGETYVGGLGGYLINTDITRGVASGIVRASTGSTAYAGGLVGLYSNGRTNGRIDNSRATGTVFVDAVGARVGGLVGQFDAGSIVNSSAAGAITAIDSQNAGASSHYTGGLVGIFGGAAISGSSATGNVAGQYMTGGLAGRYSGSGALVNATASGDVTGTQYVGGLVGQITRGGIDNGSASGDVTGSTAGTSVGGLVGDASISGTSALIANSRASGDVNGGRFTGGLVGSWTSAGSGPMGITNGSASGEVKGSNIAGGLVGLYGGSSGTGEVGIRNGTATGNVTGLATVGGLVGQYSGYAGILDSGASGNVVSTGSSTSTRYLGGLVGNYTNFNANATLGQLSRSYASGNVSLASTAAVGSANLYAGGLVGGLFGTSQAAVTLTDAYATGAVSMSPGTGGLRAGGLVGSTNTSMARVYATGRVTLGGGTGTRLVGGLVAERSGTTVAATSSYWSTDGSGVATSVVGSGRTSAELTAAATFTGWDLATTGGSSRVWRLYEGNAAPLLRGLLTPATVTLADMSKVYDGTTSLGGAVVLSSSVPLAYPERIYARGIVADAGTYALGASQIYSSQNGYDLTISGNAQLVIQRRALTLAGLVANKVYDATTAATVAASPTLGNLVAGEDLSFVQGAGFDVQFADKNAGTGKTVNISGSYTIADGVRGKASNYVLPTATTTTADITRATVTGGSFAATSRVYDGSTTVAVTATPSALTGVLGSDSVSLDLSGAVSGTVADKNVGTGKRVTVTGATLTGADAGNYLLAGLDNVRVDITPRAAVVNGLVATNRQYNGGTFVSINVNGMFLSNTVAGDQIDAYNNGVQGTIADRNVARDGNGQVIARPVTVTGVGLRGPDAANYTAQFAPVNVTITPRQVTIFASSTTGTDRVYDGTSNAVVLLSQPWFGIDNVRATATTVSFADKNVAYNTSGQVIAKTITASGITIAGTDAGNYALQNTSTTTTGTISPRGLTVSGVVATDRVYDGTRDVAVNVASATVDTSSVVQGDDVAVTIPTTGTVTGQMADKNAGTNKAVTVPGLSLTGTDRLNYTLNSATGGVTVNIARKNVNATYTAQDREYDGQPWAIATASTTDFIVGDRVSFYTNNNPYYTGNTFFTDAIPKNVGTAKPVRINFERLEGTDAPNYNLLNAGQGTTTASVTPKPVTLAFTGITKVYDGTTAATVTINRGASGVYGGDDITSTQTAVYTGTNAKDVAYDSSNQVIAKPISVSGIQIAGNDAFNYTVANTTANASGRITPKPVTVSGITAVDRAYDGTTTVQVTAGTVTSSGFVGGDNVAVVLPTGGLTTGTVADRNVGTAKPVTVTGLTLGGTDAGNYGIDIVGSGITVNIGRKLITPVYTGVSRVYDGGVLAQVTASRADIVTGDTVTFTQQAVYTGSDAKNVGTAKPVAVSNIVLGGGSQGNYQLASTTALTTADITPKPVTAVYTGLTRVYNGLGDRTIGVLGSSLQLLNGDDVSFTQTALLDGTGAAGTGKAVTVSNIGLAGADARNYSVVNTTATTSATVTPRPLGVSGATVTDRAYDGTTTVAVNVANATVDLRSVIAGDEVVITLPANGQTTGTMADRFVGAAKAVSIGALGVGGASAANYTLEGATGLTVNITPKTLLATWAGVDKIYNGSTVAQVNGSSSDIYAIDAGQVLLSAAGTFTGAGARNVGTGKTVAVSNGVLSGALRDNYQLLNPTGTTTASITARALTASYASGLTRVYDGTVNAPASGTLSNLVSGDAVGLVQTAVFTGTGARNVGTGKTIAISGATLVGVDAGNYTLGTTSYTTTGGITARPITVAGLESLIATDRVYDGTRNVVVTVPSNVTLVPSSSDIVAGDDVSIAVPAAGVTTGRVADKNVGNGKSVNVDGLTLSGTDGGNYAIAGTVGIRVNITAKPLTASYSGLNRVYNATSAASVFGTSADIVTGDTVNIAGSGFFTGAGAKNVGTGKGISITQATLSGADSGNYALLNPTGTATADITPLLLTATFSGIDKVYDGLTTATVRSTTGFLAGDDVAVTLGGASFADKNVAYNSSNQVIAKTVGVTGLALSGNDAGNYGLRSTTATTTATITPKALRIDGLTGVTAASRVYDGTRIVQVTVSSTGTLTPNANDVVAGDVVGVNAPPTGNTTGTLADKNVGNGKAVTVTGLTLSGADAPNYSVAATSGITVDITPKSLTAVYAGRDKVYDGTAAATVIGTSGDIVAGDTVAISGGGAFTGAGAKNVGSGKTIAVTGGRLTGTDAVNYTLLNGTGTATASITPRPVSALYSGGSRVYDGGVLAPVVGVVDGAIAGDELSLSANAVFTGTGAKNAGTGKAVSITGITLLGADAGNYLLGSSLASTTATITPKPLRILGLTGVSAVDRVYDGTRTVVVNVAASGSLAPNPDDVVAGDVVTISPLVAGTTTGTVATKGVGTNKAVEVNGLSLGGTDAGNYSVAATSGVTVNITPKSLTAAYNGVTRVYDGTTAVQVSGSSADIVAGDAITISGTGLFVGAGAKNVGSGKAVDVQAGRLAGVDAGNYLLLNPTGTTTGSITPRTVDAVYTGLSKVYDGTVLAQVSGTASGFIAGDEVGLSQTAAYTGVGAKNVGNNKTVSVTGIALTGGDAVNYSLAATSVTTTGSITPRPLRINGLNGITATDRVYDGTTAVAINVQSIGPVSAEGSDIIAGDDVTVALPGSSLTAGTMADKNVGVAKPVTVQGFTLSGTDAGNYRVAAATGVTVNITPRALTATYAGLSRVYDGTAHALVGGASADIVAGDIVRIEGSGVFTGAGAKNVGIGKEIAVTGGALAGADAGNYSLLNPTGTARADITPRLLTATYTGGLRVYDGTVSAPVTWTTAGLVAGDSLTLTQTAEFTGAGAKNAGTGKTVSITDIALQGDDAGNYRLAGTTATTTATITPRPVNVQGLQGQLSATDRVYDGTNRVAVTGTLQGGGSIDILAGDDVRAVLSGSGLGNGVMTDKNAGNGKAVTVEGLTLVGGDAANYRITGIAGLTVNIAPRPVVLLGISARNRVYDGTTTVVVDTAAGSIDGTLAGDDLRLLASGVTGTMTDKNVGSGKAVRVTGLALGGADAGNYVATNGASLTVDIAPRTLAARATAADKVYDGTAGLDVSRVTLADDRITNDALTLTPGSASFDGKNAASGRTVTIAGLTLGGADAGNYVLATDTVTATASILRAPLTLTVDTLTKFYGDVYGFKGSEFRALGLAAGEKIDSMALASDGAAASVHVGSYVITAANPTGANFDAANYTIGYANGNLRVDPRPISITANIATRFPTESNPSEFGWTVGGKGLAAGDRIDRVTVLAPAGSANAEGGSIFRLVPSNAVFGASTLASDYAVTYVDGTLIVLPPPAQSLGVAFDPEEIDAALKALDRNAQMLVRLSRPALDAPRAQAPRDAAEPTLAELAALLSGDGTRINLPALQRLPLISLDPQLRPWLQAPAARSGAGSTTTP